MCTSVVGNLFPNVCVRVFVCVCEREREKEREQSDTEREAHKNVLPINIHKYKCTYKK